MRDLCDVCVSRPSRTRCKCRWYDRRGNIQSVMCDKCWANHICLTRWMRLKIWWARRHGLMCPYAGIAYRRLPDYVSAYGCPVCKGIGMKHLHLTAATWGEP